MDKQYAPCFVRQAIGAKGACPSRVAAANGGAVCTAKKRVAVKT
jgi:hypothetical protein